MDLYSKKQKQMILQSTADQYIMVSLEMDEIDWSDREKTPKSVEENNECKRAKSDKKMRCQKRELCNGSLVESKKDSGNRFSSLADEVILKIFSYLPHSSIARCVSVCKRWKYLGYDVILWKQLDLRSKHLEFRNLTRILHRGVVILQLNQAEIFLSANDNCICHSDEECNENFTLTHLDTTNAKFDNDRILASVLSKCYLLRFLSLEGCNVGLAECLAISCNEKIEVLNLSMVSGLPLQGIDVITKKCTMIRSLNLSWTNQTKDCVKFILRCKNLEELNLSGLRGHVTQSIMEKLLTSCVQLVEIDLSDISLEYGILKLVAKWCQHIKKLSVSRCSEITPQSLLELIEKLPMLSHLNVFGFINLSALDTLRKLRPNILVNKETFSTVARSIGSDNKVSLLY